MIIYIYGCILWLVFFKEKCNKQRQSCSFVYLIWRNLNKAVKLRTQRLQITNSFLQINKVMLCCYICVLMLRIYLGRHGL